MNENHVAYYDETLNRHKYIRTKIGVWQEPEIVESDPSWSNAISSIKVDSNDIPCMVYYSNGLKYAKYTSSSTVINIGAGSQDIDSAFAYPSFADLSKGDKINFDFNPMIKKLNVDNYPRDSKIWKSLKCIVRPQ